MYALSLSLLCLNVFKIVRIKRGSFIWYFIVNMFFYVLSTIHAVLNIDKNFSILLSCKTSYNNPYNTNECSTGSHDCHQNAT